MIVTKEQTALMAFAVEMEALNLQYAEIAAEGGRIVAGQQISVNAASLVAGTLEYLLKKLTPLVHAEQAVIEPYVAEFLAAVRCYPGGKHPVASYYPADADEDNWPKASWQIAEANGWAVCNGSHKWTLTDLGKAAIGCHDARTLGVGPALAAQDQPA